MAQPKDMSICQKTFIKKSDTSYQKKDVLGKGNFGIVFLGSHKSKQVAVKRLELHRLDPEDREVNLQMKLEHENVLKILSVDEDDDYRYIVLELCAGTLGDVIDKTFNGPALPPDQEVLYEITNGLDYIHSKKLVHRDIKPENILISTAGKMKLSDFGLSKQISTRDTCSMSGTRGTRLWMAPEFYDNNEKATPKCDVFPCGCVFFVFLTRENGGIHPFGDTKDPLQVPLNIREGKPVNIEKLNSDHFAFSFVTNMIERDPVKRISLQEIKNKLRSIIEDFPQMTINHARENNATWATIYEPIYASGSFKNVYKGKYTEGERAGEDCVGKSFISGSVFERSFFKSEHKVVRKALEIINNFNKQRVINQTIWLIKPGIWSCKSGSKRKAEKMLIEPMISNFEKFNSNTGWTPEESSPWSDKMQALSHYSYHSTNRHLLLCDLQGGVIENGAVLTDPIIMSSTREYGPTDLGDEGISTFFVYHRCNKFCDSKWMIPNDKKTYFEKRQGSSMDLGKKLTKLKLVNQTPGEMIF
ncbi:CBL-interacting protein kinase 26-like isoform X3 [Daphnia pulex]|uniref:CBL-interacting protein kinase 26-like isoform X3 n=1 Tax=Daphnia pulex TaxID=6669 RepID=UPI001EDC9CBD|nr:CBL-interacting protein kinase 26-like isoform X3 [Daphnia pulex]